MPDPSTQVFNPEGHASFHPSYSHVSTTTLHPTSKLISVAGQIGHDSATNTIPSSFLAQVELALANVQTCLTSAGAKKTDIVSVRQYVVNVLEHDYAKRVELYVKFMDGHKPPSTLIGVQALATKDLLYEIEVTAVVHG
jgi:enamine deaminase RidA (YjgF/YER057c/UK114 family)